MRKFLPLGLVVPLLLVTGCPSNQYSIDLTPRGNVIERKLVFYRADGTKSKGVPNYVGFDAAELARITSLYPQDKIEEDAKHQVFTVTGGFGPSMPNDVGGSGSYTNIKTSLGSAGFYMERFRGNDDLATQTEKRLKAADELTDYVLGWSRKEFRHERGYENLRRFLDTDFRRDLKNLAMYAGMMRSSYVTRSDAPEEFAVRYGQYLIERGYLKVGDLPGLFHGIADNDSLPFAKLVQRFIASKLGVPENRPMPPKLAFLADPVLLERSWTNYLATTDAYQKKLYKWHKEKMAYELDVMKKRAKGLINPASPPKAMPQAPDRPSPSEVENDVMGEMMAGIGDLFWNTDDHVTVRLSLPSAPAHSNGKWDGSRKQIVWESDIENSTNDVRPPSFCYASWSEPDVSSQKQHFGSVVLSGDNLCGYCLWRAALGKKEADEWDALLAGLQPDDYKAKLVTFRFSSDPPLKPKDNPRALSDSPKDLLRVTDKDSSAEK